MAARNKLNEAHLFMALIGAAYVGLVFNSWAAFGIAAGVLIGLNLIGSYICFRGVRRRLADRPQFAGSRR